ncbi:MAG: hypothetical protein R3F11_04555 [Verrucomicrobiales bacterium]
MTKDFRCPNCGNEMHPNQKRCKLCGDEPIDYGALDLYDPEEFDYDQFLEDEFGGRQKKKSGKEILWIATAVLLLIAFAAAFIF